MVLLEELFDEQMRSCDFMTQDDSWLICRFRLSKVVFFKNMRNWVQLCQTQRNYAVPASLQVLTTLGFIALQRSVSKIVNLGEIYHVHHFTDKVKQFIAKRAARDDRIVFIT